MNVLVENVLLFEWDWGIIRAMMGLWRSICKEKKDEKIKAD